jgi:hypothetical protein
VKFDWHKSRAAAENYITIAGILAFRENNRPPANESDVFRFCEVETLDQSSRLLFVHTAGNGGYNPGRPTLDSDGDR